MPAYYFHITLELGHKPPTRSDGNPSGTIASGLPLAALGDLRLDAIAITDIAMKSPAAAIDGRAIKGRFVPADPHDIAMGWGVVHLYRDGHETPGLDAPDTSASAHEGTMLCILAVPAYMTPSDLLGFVGEQTREQVSHFRLIRTSRDHKYMVLMKFRDATNARIWRSAWDGRAFNSMEPEYCRVVFVRSVRFLHADADATSFPDLTNDPFAPALPNQSITSLSLPPKPLDGPSLASSLIANPYAPTTPALVELPTCPVCLERMDETTGLLTILCQHVFHCACLEKWRGSGCPVCRYTQNDGTATQRHGDHDDGQGNQCVVCGSAQNLWICLICGHTGCGRYDSAHAFAHYETTSHTYAMDIITQHVWDYAGDGYVHRLVQNKTDGKLVDMPASTQQSFVAPGMTGYANDTVPREKLDNMGLEYAYLLTSQLESQRAYFEDQLERTVHKAAKVASSADESSRSVASLSNQLEKLQLQYKDVLSAKATLEKESIRNSLKAKSASDLARKLTKQYKEEHIINESLMEKISHLERKSNDAQNKIDELENSKRDLEEQNRDLSFYISSQAELKTMVEEGSSVSRGEVEDGIIIVDNSRKGKIGNRKGKGKVKY